MWDLMQEFVPKCRQESLLVRQAVMNGIFLGRMVLIMKKSPFKYNLVTKSNNETLLPVTRIELSEPFVEHFAILT